MEVLLVVERKAEMPPVPAGPSKCAAPPPGTFDVVSYFVTVKGWKCCKDGRKIGMTVVTYYTSWYST